MASIDPYLHFEKDCEKAFNFYKSVFGGEFTSFNRFSEMPPHPEYKVPEEEKDRVMHVTLPIGKDSYLRGSDTSSVFNPNMTPPSNNFSVSVNVDSQEEADRVFQGLAEGGQVTMPIGKTFWNSYFGSCNDQFGVQWMVSFDLGQQS